MNFLIKNLYDIALKPRRTILGLMSGTSLDGLDLALCHIKGHGKQTRVDLLSFVTLPYPAEYQKKIRKVFAQRAIDQADLSGLNVVTALLHADLVNQALREWNISADDVDLVASHGQTVFHAPADSSTADYPNNTFQIGDGDHIAVKTGITTIADFRQKHVAAGGQGAPLVLYGDFLMFSDPTMDRILLNMGGIANLTYLPSDQNKEDGKIAMATDVGPANTLMNQYMLKHFQVPMDLDANIARQGTVQQALLDALFQHAFFEENFPKTTGPELFNLPYLKDAQARSGLTDLNHTDIMATLCAFSAQSIIRAIKKIQGDGQSQARIYASGGGLHNPLLLSMLKHSLPGQVHPFDTLGLPSDAKEAVLFAVLANETVAGTRASFDELQGVPKLAMGKICFPY